MRVCVAALATETNTFAPWPTGRRGFEETGIFRCLEAASANDPVIRCVRQVAAQYGDDLELTLSAKALPSGPTLQHVYEEFRDEIIQGVEKDGPFDIVLLFLHGAMVATLCDDCEGDLITRVRERVGTKCIIGVHLDPHCHLTPTMLWGADAIVLMKEYPHMDGASRAEELYNICRRTAEGTLKPTSSVFDCRMVGFYPTTNAPMKRILHRMSELEQEPGVVSVSFVHGFPWGDTLDSGSRVLAIADNDQSLADRCASELGHLIYSLREALLPDLMEVDAALDAALATSGCVVLADTADNAGGGAPSDNVAMLRRMLDRGITNAVYGCVWDPQAVRACEEAEVGAVFELRLGGKSGKVSGDPLDAIVQVLALKSNHVQRGLNNRIVDLGPSAWLQINGIDVVISSYRSQTFSPEAFEGLGIPIAGRLIIVKSMQHFQLGFGPIADRVIAVATAGTIQMQFSEIQYTKKRDLAYFPRVKDPFSSLGISSPGLLRSNA